MIRNCYIYQDLQKRLSEQPLPIIEEKNSAPSFTWKGEAKSIILVSKESEEKTFMASILAFQSHIILLCT